MQAFKSALIDTENVMLITTDLLRDGHRSKQRLIAFLLTISTSSIVLSGNFISTDQANASTPIFNEPFNTVMEVKPLSVKPDTFENGIIIKSTKKKTVKVCKNKLVVLLREVGFKKANLKEAWAVAMRESRGNAKSISSTQDYGIFQFNKFTHSKEKWWNSKKLLDARYNANIAFKMSRGGKTWYPWGLDGQGKVKAQVFRGSGWSDERIKSDIEAPFDKFVKEFRALPAHCH
jgi:hypothetical protein